MDTTSEDNVEKYRRTDGTIDWGRRARENYFREEKEEEEKKNKQTKSVEELSVYKLANELADEIWDIVAKWDWFAKKTIGDQVVRSADSIPANITEGYGRYFFGDYIVFLYYARGSLYETKFWVEKAKKRDLINEETYKKLKLKLDELPIEINKVVKIISEIAEQSCEDENKVLVAINNQ